MTAPIVKWAGGKRRLLPELRKRVPETFGTYFEPFAGGAALFFALAPECAVLTDANEALMRAYAAVAVFTDEVCALLEEHRRYHDDVHYRVVRDLWNTSRESFTEPLRAAVFLYLNRTCFNGLWRVNKRGEFNVPMGDYRDPLAGYVDKVRAAAPVLARADIRAGDYWMHVMRAVAGDFVYFDPPYDGTFTAYTPDGFGEDDQRALATNALDLVERGVHVLLSNADTPLIRSLYAGWKIETVKCGRAINADAGGRGAVDEVLISLGE